MSLTWISLKDIVFGPTVPSEPPLITKLVYSFISSVPGLSKSLNGLFQKKSVEDNGIPVGFEFRSF